MLVIDNDNIKYFDGETSISAVLDRYPSAILNLSERDVKHLLTSGRITRAQMYQHWSNIAPDMVEETDISLLSRSELSAILKNPRTARLGLKHEIFRTIFPEQQLRRAYDNITMDEVIRFEVKLEDVIDNLNVSLDVKRGLIRRDFKLGRLPITTVEALAPFNTLSITKELVCQLNKLNYDELLISNDLFSRDAINICPDLSSRLLLNLCGRYDEIQTANILNREITGLGAEEFFSMIKGPENKTQSRRVLEIVPHHRRLAQYIASRGHFDVKSIEGAVELIELTGEMVDAISLYENVNMNDRLRAHVIPYLAMTLSPSTYRRDIFDRIIVECDTALLNEFCESFIKEPVFFRFMQSPRAFKRSAIYCMEHLTPWPGIADDIMRTCQDEEFSNKESLSMISELLLHPNGADTCLYLLLSGVSTDHKELLVQKLEQVTRKELEY